jgi:hypothetical protein
MLRAAKSEGIFHTLSASPKYNTAGDDRAARERQQRWQCGESAAGSVEAAQGNSTRNLRASREGRRAAKREKTTRSDAIRRLIDRGLGVESK